jgi:hypothetical protein
MNFYQVLKVPCKATQNDLDRAYNQLIKESRYDNSINTESIEIAYRLLSDTAQRAAYDASIAEDEKRQETAGKLVRRKRKRELSVQRMKGMVIVLLILTTIFFVYRFGYYLKSFSIGDQIYYSYSNKFLGTIVQEESNHSFGKTSDGAYLIRIGPKKTIWVPKTDVKAVCYTK